MWSIFYYGKEMLLGLLKNRKIKKIKKKKKTTKHKVRNKRNWSPQLPKINTNFIFNNTCVNVAAVLRRQLELNSENAGIGLELQYVDHNQLLVLVFYMTQEQHLDFSRLHRIWVLITISKNALDYQTGLCVQIWCSNNMFYQLTLTVFLQQIQDCTQ